MRRRLMQNPGIEWDEYGRAIIDGYEVVDLGPDFDFVFATCNVGAEHEYDYGNYYMYGSGAQVYDKSNTVYTGTENPLKLSKDTARQVMGGNWRMPTKDEWTELNTLTTVTYNVTINGIKGSKYSTTVNDVERYVFIPYTGSFYGNGRLSGAGDDTYLWSSTPNTSAYAYDFRTAVNPNNSTYVYYRSRNVGYPVRGVISKSDISSHQSSQLPYTDTVSYLQSSGTQYIKTGINGGPNIKIVIDGAFLSSTNSFHGAENSKNKIVIGVYNSKFYLRHGGGKSVVDVDTSRHTFSAESGTVTFDGTSYSVNAYSGTAENGEIYLFADNIQGTVSSYTSFKLYSAKIYSGGTLVRDFIPVRVGQTGCLYDSVSGTLFENQGSGSFSFG